ncbi:MAG: hypothetical protein KGI79_03220 [Patescibacteria group bacterium]|nr:hypothetical protein [Patescibacteria group bacterium]
MYPRIDSWEPEDQIIRKLGDQVAELLKKDGNYRKAMSIVLTHRYNGRFRKLRQKVTEHLQIRSAAKRANSQLQLAL